ncbi:MAG: type II toxin-antitoxin system VapC family toxin [Thiothrix sp.]|nr:MAG: type II toxin-antitoxin system VapC family toxin [Thiothrix sp.]
MDVKYLLDTNICIYIFKQQPPEVIQRFRQLKVGEVGISAITYAELYFGALKHPQSVKYQEILTLNIEPFEILYPNKLAYEHYADIRLSLMRAGKPIGTNDLWIAGHARSLGVTLVTNNLREFERVPNLKLENWVN